MSKSKSFKILIVDDIPKNIQVVSNILKSEGYQMSFARDGKSALKKLESTTFDLVLLDIMMPEMDGFEVCQRVRENESLSETPIIFITAKSDAESIVKGLELGAVDYISKPFNHAELKARVKTHLQMKHIREKLTLANATKDKFFSIIAHDLRNPFSHILGFSEILLERFDRLEDQRKIGFINNIHSSSLQVFRLLENLLNWSRIQLGTFEWQPAKINLSKIVEEIIDLLVHQAEAKKIKLRSEIISQIVAYGDSNMVETIIRNLISNAIKFTPEYGSIIVDAIEKDNLVEIAITDTGMGIPENDLERLFKIEDHFSNKGTNDEQGTGLGLILCKDFVEKNGGQISARSKPGKGSTFKFTIPLPQG